MELKKFFNAFLKISSGRFILTITGAFSFLIIIKCLCEILIQRSSELQTSDVISIFNPMIIVLSNIFTFYFVKSGMQNNNHNGDNNEERNNGSSDQTSSSDK